MVQSVTVAAPWYGVMVVQHQQPHARFAKMVNLVEWTLSWVYTEQVSCNYSIYLLLTIWSATAKKSSPFVNLCLSTFYHPLKLCNNENISSVFDMYCIKSAQHFSYLTCQWHKCIDICIPEITLTCSLQSWLVHQQNTLRFWNGLDTGPDYWTDHWWLKRHMLWHVYNLQWIYEYNVEARKTDETVLCYCSLPKYWYVKLWW